MKTREALIQYFADQGIGNPDEWYQDNWYRIGKLPVYPMWGLKDSLILHDIHHLVTGYDTSPRGELELAGWELGSGGCAQHKLFWVDRLFFALLGLILAPAATWKAFRRGWKQRNLYRLEAEKALAMDVAELRRRVTA